MTGPCRPPIFLDALLPDPALVRRLLERHGPYAPVQRYFASDAEYRALSGERAGGAGMIVAPNFRGDWAYGRPLVDGVEPIFRHPGLRDAAARLFESERVRPLAVYANLTWQLPFPQGGGHTDVPAFRGFDRTRYPVWLLSAMGHSGLFEPERIRIATAVAWFWEGEGGGFEYWPDGPDAPPRVHEGAIHNTACMGDNDRMFHRVRPVGRPEDGMLTGLTLDSRLERVSGDDWRIVDGGRTLARLRFDAIRTSVSWKAIVFRDAAEERCVDEGRGGLGLDEVVARFGADLERRGVALRRPDDPLRDPDFVETLRRAYVRDPRVPAAA